MGIRESWFYSEREVTLVGEFTCRLTPQERNEWSVYVRDTDQYLVHHIATRQFDKNPCRETAEVDNQATKALYVVAAVWHAGLLKRRDEAKSEEAAKDAR